MEGKGMKMSRGPFFFFSFYLFIFFCLLLFATNELGLPKWTIFTWKNHISRREKIGKTDFAPPQKKYSSYAPGKFILPTGWLKLE